jgi:hypothetical protein
MPEVLLDAGATGLPGRGSGEISCSGFAFEGSHNLAGQLQADGLAIIGAGSVLALSPLIETRPQPMPWPRHMG